MKINKHTPPNDLNSKLLQNLDTQENQRYAKKLDNLEGGGYGKTVLKAMLSAAAVLVVAAAVGIFALIGREIWHTGKQVPASAPDYPNYIFVEGKFAAIAHDGIFMDPLMMGRVVSYNEILENECFYDTKGQQIKEIYINVSELKQLNYGETQTIASRLKKYASGEYRNYYKFTLPVQFDENEMPIPINSDSIEFLYSEDEIKAGTLSKEHRYVSVYKLDIKEINEFEVRLTKDDRERLGELISWVVLQNHYAVAADIDGDGKDEKIASLLSDPVDATNQYRYVAVIDEQNEWVLCSDFETMQGQGIEQYYLSDLIDFDLDGKYELVVTVGNKNKILGYSVQENSAINVFTVFTKTEQTGITIREFAARVSYMALGREHDPDYPSDDVCEWYYRYIESDDLNLDKPITYNQIYFGVEAFAKMHKIDLVGWDKETVWEPLANLYDPITTATREKAEELLQKAKTAFENSQVKLDYTDENITKMTVNRISMDYKDIIEDNLEVLKNIKVTDIKYIGGVTGVYDKITLYNADGDEVASFCYDKGHLYMNGCCYTVEGTPFDDLTIIIETGRN